jgi:tetratricopeptide (TPR) repeat protein
MPSIPIPRRTVQVAMVVGLAIAAFIPALGGEFVSDDRALLVGDEEVAEAATREFWSVDAAAPVEGLYRQAYRPLVQVLFALERQLFGTDPAGFHLVNLLLHALVAWLTLRWLTRRFADPDDAATGWAALLGALLFALHPVHAESVAWISGRTDLLMALCWLVGLELLERRSWPGVIAGACVLGLGLLAKEPIVLAPALILLDAWARGRADARTWQSLGVVTLVLVAVLSWAHASSVSKVGQASLPSLAAALSLTGWYASMALLPRQLTFQAQPHVVGGDGVVMLPTWSIALGALLWVGALVLLVSALRAPRVRGWLADVAWFFVPLAPALLLVQDTLSDRFLYVPILGLSAVVARGLARALCAQRWLRVAAPALAVLLLAGYLPASVRASQAFLDSVALWRSQHEARPDLPQAADALAEELASLQRYDEALVLFEQTFVQALARRQRPFALHVGMHLVATHVYASPPWDEASMSRAHGTCQTLLESRRLVLDAVGRTYSLTLDDAEYARASADAAGALTPCARAALATGNVARGVELAQRAVAAAPGSPPAQEVLVSALALAGRHDDALRQLAALREQAGRESLSELEQRIRTAQQIRRARKPASDRERALLDAELFLVLGSPVAARKALTATLEADPTDHEVVRLAAQTFVTQRRFVEARQLLERAGRLAPADPYWQQSLAALAEAELQADARR